MSKFKKAVKAVAGFVNDIVPNEIKPIVKVGLALIPGVGPALSAAYTATDAYGGGASLGNAIGQGVKSYAISQVAGAASKSLGLSSTGNDLTDALGTTKSDGILGLGSGATGSTTLGNTASATASSTATTTAATTATKSAADTAFMNNITANVGKTASSAGAAGGLFTFDNVTKGVGLAAGVGSVASALSGPKAVDSISAASTATTDKLSADAAAAIEEENRRKRKNASSNIYTSPLGLLNSGQTAAAQLLG